MFIFVKIPENLWDSKLVMVIPLIVDKNHWWTLIFFIYLNQSRFKKVISVNKWEEVCIKLLETSKIYSPMSSHADKILIQYCHTNKSPNLKSNPKSLWWKLWCQEGMFLLGWEPMLQKSVHVSQILVVHCQQIRWSQHLIYK